MGEALYDHFEEFVGAYMFLCLGLTLFTGLPVAVALGGIAVAFAYLGVFFEYLDMTYLWGFFPVPKEMFILMPRIWGGDGSSGAIQNPILVAIPCFIFMGTMLERSRVAADLLHILQVVLKRVPGGLALSVTVMGTIMAATTGIIGASVVMMTLLALPTMLDRGYNPQLATGTIAASATLGILIPPSIMLVLMANLLSVSVGNLFIGAILPGLLLSGLYFVYILSLSTIKPSMAPPLPDDAIQLNPTNYARLRTYFMIVVGLIAAAIILSNVEALADVSWGLLAFFGIFAASMIIGRAEGDSLFGAILKGMMPPIFLITLVLGSIFAGWATPTEAAGVGAFGSIILALFNGTLTRQVLTEVCHRTALTTAMIFFIFVGATAFSYMFRALYGEDLIIEFIRWLDLGAWPLLIMLMAAIFLLGFFFDFIEITLIILPVFAPIIKSLAPEFAPHLGVEGAAIQHIQAQTIYWFAILAAVNLQTSFLTPPFGFALFYMKGTAGDSVKMTDIYKGIIPFVILQLIGLAIVIEFPALTLWLPELMLD
jgi:TRAP-type mannitol/chloroaromatic compound transport system permease large subunit